MSERRVALVTGANRGIGLEVCRQLADRGVRVVLTGRNRAAADAAAARLRAKSGEADVSAEVLDVTFVLSCFRGPIDVRIVAVRPVDVD